MPLSDYVARRHALLTDPNRPASPAERHEAAYLAVLLSQKFTHDILAPFTGTGEDCFVKRLFVGDVIAMTAKPQNAAYFATITHGRNCEPVATAIHPSQEGRIELFFSGETGFPFRFEGGYYTPDCEDGKITFTRVADAA